MSRDRRVTSLEKIALSAGGKGRGSQLDAKRSTLAWQRKAKTEAHRVTCVRRAEETQRETRCEAAKSGLTAVRRTRRRGALVTRSGAVSSETNVGAGRRAAAPTLRRRFSGRIYARLANPGHWERRMAYVPIGRRRESRVCGSSVRSGRIFKFVLLFAPRKESAFSVDMHRRHWARFDESGCECLATREFAS